MTDRGTPENTFAHTACFVHAYRATTTLQRLQERPIQLARCDSSHCIQDMFSKFSSP